MRRVFIVLALLMAWPALATEKLTDKWIEAYNRGVSSVRTNNFQAGAQALQRAVDEMPQENAAQRVQDQIFTYVPHFWLGIAKLNLADPDGALREWKISEDQGAIQNTPYYAQLRVLIGRANSQKQRSAEGAATPAKKEANDAIGRALSAQMEAVSSGGNRSDTYHAAERKLGESKELNAKAGIDVRAYKRAADVAEEARNLFAAAADDAKKQRAARQVKPTPVPSRKASSIEFTVPFDDSTPPKQPIPVQSKPPAPAPITQTVAPPQPKTELKQQLNPEPVAEREELVAARIAVQEYRRRLVSLNLSTSDAQRLERQLTPQSDATTLRRVMDQIAAKQRELDDKAAAAVIKPPVEVIAPAAPARLQFEAAYRAFAAGDLVTADRLTTQILSNSQNAEAYLLRGCTRFTQAMLARNREPLLASATSDMQAALRINRSLRLEGTVWSPKLVTFFEQVKTR